MIRKFKIMWRNDIVSEVWLDEESKKVKITNYSSNKAINPFIMNKDFNSVMRFLESRRFSSGRFQREKCFEEDPTINGDFWRELEWSRGQDYDDMCWIKFPEDPVRWNDNERSVEYVN